MQLERYGIKPLVFERDEIGGLLRNANLVENYPGFPGGIAGPKLLRLFARQARQVGISVIPEAVTSLDWDGAAFRAETPSGVYNARVAVIAAGTKPKALTGLDFPPELSDRIGYEVFPLLGIHGQQVIIIGAGDAAFDYALNLSRRNKVIILNRGDQVHCLPLLRERARICTRIHYRPNTAITRLVGLPEGGMTVECLSPAGAAVIEADYLLGAIGRDPQLDFVSAALLEQSAELESRGILHFVGDVKNGLYRQTAIAVGDGLLAAMKIYQLLKEDAQ